MAILHAFVITCFYKVAVLHALVIPWFIRLLSHIEFLAGRVQ